MKKIFLCWFMSAALYVCGDSRPTICLNMIVKDETPVITRCLASVKPIIDHWVIVDTGSTDGTQEMIKNFMKDVPGELYERPWVNFAHNRSEALDLAKDKGDYLLLIDADEVLSFENNFTMPLLTKDFYYIETALSGSRYMRVGLINNRFDWKWIGVVHETLDSPNAKSVAVLENVTNISKPEGNRSLDPLKFHKDSIALEEALKNDPNNSRNVFYLAQSYKDSGQYEKAQKMYEKRTGMGGWNEEIFWSLLQASIMKEELKKDPIEIISSYKQAYAYRPTRVEPLYRLALYQRKNENFADGYLTAALGLAQKKSNDILFVEKWIQDYGLLLEYSISAYWTNRFVESLLASNLLLSQKELPSNVKECVEINLVWINEKLSESIGKSSDSSKENSNDIKNLPETQSRIFANIVHHYYVAESFKNAGYIQKAIEQYENTASQSHDIDEKYWGMLQVALLKEQQNYDSSEIVTAYQKAHSINPKRAETYYRLANYQRKNKNYTDAFLAATQGIERHNQTLSLNEDWIYEYGLLFEYALNAYWTKNYVESYIASELLLSKEALPNNVKTVVEKNLSNITTKLHEYAKDNTTLVLEIGNLSRDDIGEDDLIDNTEITEADKIQTPSFEMIPTETKNTIPVTNDHQDTNPISQLPSPVEEPTSAKKIDYKDPHHFPVTQEESRPIINYPIYYEEEVIPEYIENFYPEEVEYYQTPIENESYDINFINDDYSYQNNYDNDDSTAYTADVYAIGTVGRGLGYIGSYATIGVFADFGNQAWQPFIDLRGHDFGNDRWGNNTGVGLRYIDENAEIVYGVNAFYDYRERKRSLQQYGFGIELSGTRYDLFANCYIPFGRQGYKYHHRTFNYPGGFIAEGRKHVEALRGADVEVGTSSRRWTDRYLLDLYIGLGAYYYEGHKAFRHSFAGTKYRAELSYYDLFGVGINGTYDDVFQNTLQGYFVFNCPFDDKGFAFCRNIRNTCFLNGITGDPVQRNPIIVESKPQCCWKTNYNLSSANSSSH